MELHRKTFNHMGKTATFMRANGVPEFFGYSPEYARPKMHYDLVTSFGAWCFHLPPSDYLAFVNLAAHARTRLIVELRKKKIVEYS